jgi:5-methylcytosine-specific restriction endonuclease McrA
MAVAELKEYSQGVCEVAGKIDRQKIKNKFDGKCAYCGIDLNDKFHVDHIKPLYRNNENINIGDNSEDNLFPSCQRCNRWKKVFSIEQFRAEIKLQVERLNKYNANYRLAKDYGLVSENDINVIFYFEKINCK